MGQKIDAGALDTLFFEARSFAKWQQRPVTDETLQDLYDLLKWGPRVRIVVRRVFRFCDQRKPENGFDPRSPRSMLKRR